MIFYLSYRARRRRLLDYLLVLPMIGFSMAFAVYSGWTHDWIGIGLGVVATYLCSRLHEFLKTTIQLLEKAPYE